MKLVQWTLRSILFLFFKSLHNKKFFLFLRSHANSSTSYTKFKNVKIKNEPNCNKIFSENNNNSCKSGEIKSIVIKKKSLNSLVKNLVNESASMNKFEKSTQTTQDLLIPMFIRELKRRKAYGISLFDESDSMGSMLENINDKFEENSNLPPTRHFNRSLSVFGKFQTYLIPNRNEFKLLNSTLEFPNLLQKKSSKNKNSHSTSIPCDDYNPKTKLGSIKSRIKMNTIIKDKEDKTDLKQTDSLDSFQRNAEVVDVNEKSTTEVKKSLQILSEIEEQVETSEDKNEDSTHFVTNQSLQAFDNESSVSSSLSNLYTNDAYKSNNIIIKDHNSTTSDIESNFMLNLDQEDEDLEKFKNILLRENLVLNWDYAQSSDYL